MRKGAISSDLTRDTDRPDPSSLRNHSRPRNINDVAHQEEVVRTLEKALETANMPHMLFYGPPGTGKTTCALAICRQLYGPELIKSRVLELNASDERGISVVRNKIKGFASTAVGQGAPGSPSPPYKILILDEATSNLDSATDDAVQALLRDEFGGRTIITVAHRINTVVDYDAILVMADGRLVEQGAPKDLLADRTSALSAMVGALPASAAASLRRRAQGAAP